LLFIRRFYLTKETRLIQFQDTVEEVKLENVDTHISDKFYNDSLVDRYIAFKLGVYYEESDSYNIFKILMVMSFLICS